MSGSGKTPGQAAPGIAPQELSGEFAGWFAAQGYPSPDDRYDGEEMAEAFAAGMQAQRDLDAAAGHVACDTAIGSLRAELEALRAELADVRERAEFYESERDSWRATAEGQRTLLDEIGVMAANAPEDGDLFGLLEEIAMRIAADGVPDSTPLDQWPAPREDQADDRRT